MIRTHLRGAVCGALLGALSAAPASALLEDNLSSLADEQAVGYLSPLASGLSGSLNSGIFKSGHVPTTGLNFTIDVKAAWMSFSDDDRTFATPTTGGFESVDAPTVIGDTQSVAANHTSVTGLQFAYPGGFDMSNFGIATPQLTVGSVLGTRAMIRWIPSVDLGDEDIGSFEMFGIGGQHSISQYLPGVPVDLALGVMYQNFKIGDGIVDATALAFNVTGSKVFGKVVTLEPYVGLGLDSFEMTAEYTSGSETVTADFGRSNDAHLTLGAGLNLPVLKIHGEYDVAAVNGFAGGVSFGI